jgi:peptide/nickel transport system permease protein
MMATSAVQSSQTLQAALPARTRSRPGLLQVMIRQKAAAIGLTICLLVLGCAIFAPVLAPYDPLAIAPADILQRPSAAHWLGTDELGRDVLSRILFGARVSVFVGATAIIIALACGVLFGMLSGYYGGAVDSVIMRCMDALAAFPAVLLALGILSALGPGIRNATIAVGIVYIPAFSRVMRSAVLSIKQQEYVEAATAVGGTPAYVMHRAILPNTLSPLLVHASIGFANAIIVEAALGFLGLGAQPPSPSWGMMLNDGRQFLGQNVWYSVSAGAAIFVSVLGLNLLGDGLRDALDPRLRAS